MGAVVFNVVASAEQQTDASALSGSKGVISSNASANKGLVDNSVTSGKIGNTIGIGIALNTIKQTSTLITSNAGKITGNSHLQNQINNGMKLGGLLVGAVTHPVLTLTAAGIDYGNYAVNKFFVETEDKFRSSQAQAIAGTLKGRKN